MENQEPLEEAPLDTRGGEGGQPPRDPLLQAVFSALAQPAPGVWKTDVVPQKVRDSTLGESQTAAAKRGRKASKGSWARASAAGCS